MILLKESKEFTVKMDARASSCQVIETPLRVTEIILFVSRNVPPNYVRIQERDVHDDLRRFEYTGGASWIAQKDVQREVRPFDGRG